MAGWDLIGLRDALRGALLPNEPLARHTTYGVGGPVDALVLPLDVADLCACLRYCSERSVPCRVLGDGSNILVADEGLPGVVVRLTGEAFCQLEPEPGDEHWEIGAGAGLGVGRLVALARREGLRDLVFLSGIPGTVGGAVRMNAGTTAGEMAAVLLQVEVALPDGTLRSLSPGECRFSYRRSALPSGSVVVGVRLASQIGAAEEVAADVARYLRRRKATQPTGATAGCVFKNPTGDHAGRLIDAAGLKGLRRGAAEVSQVHANFIVAQPGARAADVHALIRAVQARVGERFGVRLEPENLLLGFDRTTEEAP